MRRVFIIAICALLAVPAVADLTGRITVTDGPGNGDAGAFTAKVAPGTAVGIYEPGDTFLTFCIENNEYFNPGGTYYVAINTMAVAGGSGGGSPDPLSPISAALYNQWLGGNTSDVARATQYQLAIWQQEGEAVYGTQWTKGDGTTALHADYQAISQATINALIAGVGNPGSIGNVRVMNLWANADGTGAKQDMLVTVPVPAAVLLGFLGLSAAGIRLRRFV